MRRRITASNPRAPIKGPALRNTQIPPSALQLVAIRTSKHAKGKRKKGVK
jgi:hypothetical protein